LQQASGRTRAQNGVTKPSEKGKEVAQDKKPPVSRQKSKSEKKRPTPLRKTLAARLLSGDHFAVDELDKLKNSDRNWAAITVYIYIFKNIYTIL